MQSTFVVLRMIASLSIPLVNPISNFTLCYGKAHLVDFFLLNTIYISRHSNQIDGLASPVRPTSQASWGRVEEFWSQQYVALFADTYLSFPGLETK